MTVRDLFLNPGEQGAAENLFNSTNALLGLGPVAALGLAYQQDVSNAFDAALKSPGRLNSRSSAFGSAIGKSARAAEREQEIRRRRSAKEARENLQKTIMNTDAMQDLQTNIRKRTEVIDSFSRILDDPNLGLPDHEIIALKDNLISAANSDTVDIESTITRVVDAIQDSGNDNLFKRLDIIRNSYHNLGALIPATPTGLSEYPVAFNGNAQYSKSVSAHIDKLQNILGSRYRVVPRQFQDIGLTFNVAQIYDQVSGRWVFNMNLSGDLKDPSSRFAFGGSHFDTIKTAPGYIVDVARSSPLMSGASSVYDLDPYTMRDYTTNLIEAEIKRTGRVDWQAMRMGVDELYENVARTARSNTSYAKHLRQQGYINSSRIHVAGLELLPEEARIRFSADLGRLAGIDVPGGGGKNIQSRRGNKIVGAATTEAFSPYGAWMRSFGLQGGAAGRDVITVAQRMEQMGGRTKQTIESVSNIGRARNIAIGSLADDPSTAFNPYRSRTGKNLITGGLSRPALIDFRPAIQGERTLAGDVAGQGYGYMGKNIVYQQAYTPAVYDPAKSKMPYESADLRRIIDAGPAGVTFTGDAFLGEGPNGPVRIKRSPSTTAVHLYATGSVPSRVSGGTKWTIPLAGFEQRNMSLAKVFSSLFKGNLETVSTDQMKSYMGSALVDIEAQLSRTNVAIDDLVYITPDMMKKSPGVMMEALASSAIIHSTSNLSIKDITSKAWSAGAARRAGGWDLIEDFARATTELMVSSGASPYDIGSTLSGVYYGGLAGEKYGLPEATVRNMITNHIGDAAGRKEALRGMKQGHMLAVMIGAIGEGKYDWNRSTASIEPRTAMGLMERFETMGFSTGKAAEMVGNFYGSKRGFTEGHRVVTELLPFVKSITGEYNAGSYLSDMNAGVKRYSYNDFAQAVAQHDKGIIGLMSQSEEGFVVDFAHSSSKLKNAVARAFGGSEVRIPGRDLLDSTKGTQIRVGSGVAVDVESEISRLFGRFYNDLTQNAGNVEQLAEALKDFRSDANDLFSNALVGITRGKLQGSTSPIAENLTLDQNSIWNAAGHTAKLEKARKVMARTTGRASFFDSDAFLSQMLDLESVQTLKRRSELMRYFFTGMEGGNTIGILGAMGRHPQLSTGNIWFTQIFRNPNEIASLGGEDLLFKQFKESAAGRDLLRRTVGHKRAGNMTSFGDLTSFLGTDTKASKDFFTEFTQSLRKFYDFNSSGGVKVPKLLTDQGFDVGQGAAAYLDFDSDHVTVFLPGRDDARAIMKSLRSGNHAQADYTFRKFMQLMGGQSKQAIANLAQRMPAGSRDAFLEGIKKEVGLSLRTGPLDVSLKRVHNALFDYSDDIMTSILSRGVLGDLQENWVIKSKKLEAATDLPKSLQRAANYMMDSGDTTRFESVLREMYKGTDFANGGITFDLSDVAGLGKEYAALIDGTKQTHFSLDMFIENVRGAVTQARKGNTGYKTSSQAMSRMLDENPSRAIQILSMGTDAQSAALRAFRSEADIAAKASFAGSQLKSAISGLDKSLTGKLALGLTAGAFIMGMTGNDYAPEPLIVDNEARPAAGILNEISSSNLLQSRDPAIEPSTNHGYNDYSSTNLMYVDKPNSYQVRGRITSQSGLDNAIALLPSLNPNASGSVMINDTRRPLSLMYVDKALGDY